MRQLKISKQLTNRDSKSIDKYLSDVSKEEMITAEEEVELAKRIKQGDELALNKLVNANLRFVIIHFNMKSVFILEINLPLK